MNGTLGIKNKRTDPRLSCMKRTLSPGTPLAVPGAEITPFALGDWSPALMYPDVVAVWFDTGGNETRTGGSIHYGYADG